MRSSSAAAIVAAVLLLAGCAGTQHASDSDVRGIGYVRLDDVIKMHPLYPQLSQIQDAIDALDMKSLGPAAKPLTSAQIAQQTKELNAELVQAQNRANTILRQKQADYARREQDAIRAALGSAAGGTNGNQTVRQIQGTTAQQARVAAAAANADFQNYRSEVIAQDTTAVSQVSKQLGERANQSYRQKATQLQEQESQLALELSQQDAAQRLELRTKLGNLALDDATRKQYRDRLAAIDQREAQVVAAAHTRDQQQLAAYRKQLAASTQRDIAGQAATIHAQTRAKISSRQNEVSREVASQVQGLQPVPIPSNLPATTRDRLAQIDRQFKSAFATDAKKTIGEYQSTKADLDAEYTALASANSVATGAAAKQIADLQRQRDDLYGKMVEQIKTDAKTLGVKRGLHVVFVNVTAAAGGIDLTNDVEKDIESVQQ